MIYIYDIYIWYIYIYDIYIYMIYIWYIYIYDIYNIHTNRIISNTSTLTTPLAPLTRQFCIPSAINGQTNLGTRENYRGSERLHLNCWQIFSQVHSKCWYQWITMDYLSCGLDSSNLLSQNPTLSPKRVGIYGWFMDDFWMIFGWFLNDLWMILGWFLDDLWMIFGWFLDDLWVHPLKWCASHRIPCQEPGVRDSSCPSKTSPA